MSLIVLIRGGGDLASGVAIRLHKAGLRVLITELPEPMVVRRSVSFAEAVFQGQMIIEGVAAYKAGDIPAALSVLDSGEIPVLVDPDAKSLADLRTTLPSSTPLVLVDARMTKRPPEYERDVADLVIGLGPGFVAGENCHAVIETNRGHMLGRVIWQGPPQADTGLPEQVDGRRGERVLRAPADGILHAYAQIGDLLEAGQLVAEVAGQPVKVPFDGMLRGLIFPGLYVQQGLKIGDLDPRGEARYATLVSDKSLAIGGSVLEAILSRPELRPALWE